MSSSNDALLEKLRTEVEDYLKNELFGVEELAENVGISRSHLHRKLQEATGQSVSQFIREYRLQRAKEILLSEDITAAEVAYQVGFGSATYFSKSFTDFYGYPPGEAKKRNETSIAQEGDIVVSKPKNKRVYILIGILLAIAFAGFFISL